MGEISRKFFDKLCQNAIERHGKKQIPGISRVLSVRFEMREERIRAAIAALEDAGYIMYDEDNDLATILDSDAPRPAMTRERATSKKLAPAKTEKPTARKKPIQEKKPTVRTQSPLLTGEGKGEVKKKRGPSADVRGRKTPVKKAGDLSTVLVATAIAQLEHTYVFLRDLKSRMTQGWTLSKGEKKVVQKLLVAQKATSDCYLVSKKTTPLQTRRIILRRTATYFCVETQKLYWRKRHHARIAFARQVAIFIMRTQFGIHEKTIASHLRCEVDLVQDATAKVQKRYARGDESVKTPVDEILGRLRFLREKAAALTESSEDTT